MSSASSFRTMGRVIPAICVLAFLSILNPFQTRATAQSEESMQLFQRYCIDCHEGPHPDGNLDLLKSLDEKHFDRALVFENIAVGKMPPADADSPPENERREMLTWLATGQPESDPATFRRLSRREFVHGVNDLLGTNLDLADQIPEDRGTYNFDSDRRIQLGAEVLGGYFAVTDTLLDTAFPPDGFPEPQSWVTNKLKDSHETYRIYVRDFRDGMLFSWTRANNGNGYSFFFDNFDPPVAGWYDLTLEAAKVGDFEEHVSVQVHAGRYYYADDRPQPQRLLGIVSLGNREVKPHNLRVFLNPGENVSVHCYSIHNWRQKAPIEGAYIRQLKVRGPVRDQWPPSQYALVFGDHPVRSTETEVIVDSGSPTELSKVVRRFAERAFSARISDAELAPHIEAAHQNLADHGDFVRATRLGLKTVICSPRFLMVPGEHSSPAHTQVAKLARALWLSVPDTELLNVAASSGPSELSRETLRTQIHRMLADERSDRMIESLCDQWLNLRSWNKVSPSLKLYPRYDDLLHYYLPLETRMYLSYLIRENMPVGHLIDSDYTFLNQRLAQHYRIAGVTGQQLRKITLNSESPRGGLLTMGSVLKVTTDGFQTSPILRGAWVSRNLVGTPISPPPESVNAIEPEHGTAARTLREQIEQHKTNPTCHACHKSIDPYGFALESLDATGQWRENYRVETPHQGTFQFRLEGYYRQGGEVDSSGEVDGHRFEDIFGLKKRLLSDYRRVGYNFAKKFFEYINGHAPNLTQRLALLSMLDGAADNCRMKDVVTDVLIYSLLEQTP